MMEMMISNGDDHDDDNETMMCKYNYKMHYVRIIWKPLINKTFDKDTPVSYHFISSAVKVYSLTGEWAGRGEGNWRLHKLVSSLPQVPQKTQTTKKMRVKKRDGSIHKCLLASNFSNLIFCPSIALSTFSGGKWSPPGRNDNRNTNADYEMTKIITTFIRWE